MQHFQKNRILKSGESMGEDPCMNMMRQAKTLVSTGARSNNRLPCTDARLQLQTETWFSQGMLEIAIDKLCDIAYSSE